jgi:flagellar biogenesis protein FliO
MPSTFWPLYIEKLAIVALVLAALYLAARRLRQTRLFAPSGRVLNVLESTMLSQHAALHVVSVGSRCFLIGSAAGGVTRLAELASFGEPVLSEARSADSKGSG